jgi:hypothetical protein
LLQDIKLTGDNAWDEFSVLARFDDWVTDPEVTFPDQFEMIPWIS